jgi:transcription antitermination factor NusG
MESWYVVQTKPKKEFHVEKMFLEAGLQVYNPRTREGAFLKPFFTGYEFVLFDYPAQFKLVSYTRGVRKLVGNDLGPIPIEAAWVDEIRSRERDGFIVLQKYGLEPALGDEIEVAAGPLKGLRGVFKADLSDQDRVLILLNCVSYQGKLLIEKGMLKKVVT